MDWVCLSNCRKNSNLRLIIHNFIADSKMLKVWMISEIWYRQNWSLHLMIEIQKWRVFAFYLVVVNVKGQIWKTTKPVIRIIFLVVALLVINIQTKPRWNNQLALFPIPVCCSQYNRCTGKYIEKCYICSRKPFH